MLGCNLKKKIIGETVNDTGKASVLRDYTQEPMHAIFVKHDRDKDGFLKMGEVTAALAEAGIRVVDEDLAFEWLDRNFEN